VFNYNRAIIKFLLLFSQAVSQWQPLLYRYNLKWFECARASNHQKWWHKEANHSGCLRLVDSLATYFPVKVFYILNLLILIPITEKENVPQLLLFGEKVVFVLSNSVIYKRLSVDLIQHSPWQVITFSYQMTCSHVFNNQLCTHATRILFPSA